MSVKEKAKNAYNRNAELWHRTRETTLDSFSDEKRLKQNRPHVFIEKPAMYSKVPDLRGKTVLCLGCGSGEECEYLLGKQPKKVIGIDISEKLIAIAKKTVPDAEFLVMDAEDLKFEDESFDFVYSSLLLDYFESWEKVLEEVFRVMKTGGTLLFSNIHPVKWGAKKSDDPDGTAVAVLMGFEKNHTTGRFDVFGDYLNTTLHEETWMKDISISFYTKSLSQMYREIVGAGFRVLDILEPKAIPEAKAFDEDYWRINQKIPNFIVYECRKEREISG